LPDNIRRYYHPGTPHGGGRGGFALGAASNGIRTRSRQIPILKRRPDRALYVALVDWVVRNAPPPPSVYPRVSNGTLVPANSAAIGLAQHPERTEARCVVNSGARLRLRSEFRYNDESGVINQCPARDQRVILTLVPKVMRMATKWVAAASLLQRVPLGTYTSWAPIPSGPAQRREKSLAAGLHPVREDEGRAPRGVATRDYR